MAILIDPPSWPAHGTLWSHLISDSDTDELHPFAAQLGVPRRGFDLDHYDVPASLYHRAVSLGAQPVRARDVVFSLQRAGLRVRQVDRDVAEPVARRRYLTAEWRALGAAVDRAASDDGSADWAVLGESLLARWNEPHRRYHAETHLEDVLLSLNQLEVRGERIAPMTLLAAWFHDAIYTGAVPTGDHGHSDEQASAELAAHELRGIGLDTTLSTQVSELILATDPASQHVSQHAPHHEPLAHLLDADVSIFGAGDERYLHYANDVRAEYAHVPDPEFREGRARILDAYLDRATIYLRPTARALWEDRARANVRREIARLRGELD